MFNVVCTGSRNWQDQKKIEDVLNLIVYTTINYHNLAPFKIIQGQSPGGGADLFVQRHAEALQKVNGIDRLEAIRCPMDSTLDHVDGETYGQQYLRRNIRMLETYAPGLVIAFRSEGKSSGTDHTMRQAHKRKIPVLRIDE